jgi:hypothetical protein
MRKSDNPTPGDYDEFVASALCTEGGHLSIGREIGAAWPKRSTEGRDYLSVKLDDPSFNAPIFANLFDGEDDTYNLIWSRGHRQNSD